MITRRQVIGLVIALAAVLFACGQAADAPPTELTVNAADGDASTPEAATSAASGGQADAGPAEGAGDVAALDLAAKESDLDPATSSGLNLPPEGRPDELSAWGQLDIVEGRLAPVNGAVPYTLNSALFSDHAQKLRTVWLPDGTDGARWHDEAVLDFPVGTVITKTFWYPLDESSGPEDLRVIRTAAPLDGLVDGVDLSNARLIETRVLVHRSEGWVALPYVWNDEQTEATLERTGDLQQLTLVDDGTETTFPYAVPNVNQCASCHTIDHAADTIAPIGPKGRHLNREVDFGQGAVNQLDHWRAVGLLADGPDAVDAPAAAVWDDDAAPLDARARAYLDINCAHCHNADGPADTSGLFLEASTDLSSRLGLCKPPVAAGTGTGGRRVGISPGAPEDSIFVFRMESTDPGAMMPELSRALPHEEGIDLVALWIESLPGSC